MVHQIGHDVEWTVLDQRTAPKLEKLFQFVLTRCRSKIKEMRKVEKEELL